MKAVAVLRLLMLLIFVPPASILVLPASAKNGGPTTAWDCNRSHYDVSIVQGPGNIPGTVGGTTVTYASGPGSGNSIGVDDIVGLVKQGAVKVNINFPSKKLFVSPEAAVDLMGYKADIAFSVGNLILAGSLAVAPNQTISIDADSIDEITCPQMQTISSNNCPDNPAISTPAVIWGGKLEISGVPNGVGESSCPHGQISTRDITAVSLTVANATTGNPPPPRVCLNVNDEVNTTGNVHISYTIGANRKVFVRLNGFNGENPSGTIDPTAQLFIGGGTPLCY